MKLNRNRRLSGVTLTELLVVLVIVAILSSIAVPVYVNKAENARKAAALTDCRELAEAEDSCVAQYGFYVPLQVLNDLPDINRTASGSGSQQDQINLETARILIDPSLSIDQMATLKYINASQTSTGSVTTNDPRIASMITEWAPLINFHRYGRVSGTSSGGSLASTVLDINGIQEHRDNYPLDPWKTPYLFFVPGYVVTVEGTALNTSNRFVRYAIVSCGPDGKTDYTGSDTTVTNDDIVYTFGMPKNYRNSDTTFVQ